MFCGPLFFLILFVLFFWSLYIVCSSIYGLIIPFVYSNYLLYAVPVSNTGSCNQDCVRKKNRLQKLHIIYVVSVRSPRVTVLGFTFSAIDHDLTQNNKLYKVDCCSSRIFFNENVLLLFKNGIIYAILSITSNTLSTIPMVNCEF